MGVNLYHSQLYRSQSFAKSAELAAVMEKVQLRQKAPSNAQKGSWRFKMLPHDSGTTICLVTFPFERHRPIGEVSKLKGSRVLHFAMKMRRFSQA